MNSDADRITLERAGELMQTALQALIDLGGTAKRSEVFKSVEPRLEFNEYERSLNDSGYPRWRTSIGWWSTDVAKAGWILKKNGKWHITNEGQAALALEPGEFIRQAADAYRKQLDNSAPDTTEVATVTEEEVATEEFEDADEKSRSSIAQHITRMNPYEFQDMVAELLLAMGYHVAEVSPAGRDGGIDVIAYSDPLGGKPPRFMVQVKQKPDTKTPPKEIRELVGLLNAKDEIGLFVATGGFTYEAKMEARRASVHVELIDLDKFINLWLEYYDKLRETGKRFLPLVKVFFIAPENT